MQDTINDDILRIHNILILLEVRYNLEPETYCIESQL
jgi:hypothetical protein